MFIGAGRADRSTCKPTHARVPIGRAVSDHKVLAISGEAVGRDWLMTRNRNTMHGTLRMVDAPSEQRLVMVALAVWCHGQQGGGGCIRIAASCGRYAAWLSLTIPLPSSCAPPFSHTELW